MLYSYRRAVVALPRTSQEQMNAARTSPWTGSAPATSSSTAATRADVAMYVGAGQVIHAPYPGARVRYDPVGMMPINSVTRP